MSFPVYDIPGLRTSITREDPDTGALCTVRFRSWPRHHRHGLLIHSTGPGMAKYAAKYKLSQIETVVRVYGNLSNNCAHVVVLPDGTRVRTVESYLVAPHCGVTASERSRLLDGSWRAWTSDAAEALWDARWPGVKSPQHLFPSASGNDSYEGLETWKLPARDATTGTYYTAAQYKSTAEWVVEREREWGFVAEGSRLVTHEDVQPFTRWDAEGGRDPGVLRLAPFYDWPRLLSEIAFARAATP